MATSAEKRALVFLAALAALGLGVRATRSTRGGGSADGGALDRQIASVDSAAAARLARAGGGRAASASKSGRGRAGAATGSGTRGASRPASATPRGSAAPPTGDDDPLVRYEARRRAVTESNAEASARVAARSRELAARMTPPPATQPTTRPRPPAAGPVDLDTANEAEIAAIPGIGPILAARIVSDRLRRGRFGSLQALQRVTGIGPGLSARIATHVTFSGPTIAPPTLIPLRKTPR